ncbi:MAG TPA: sigma-70 family RNA polymerase sigma factor [Pirellulales bacterium]|jgi:RNA polymerase sigma-70 factor (ECF subfamily)|nr:sigma-70 family RNA polymerase sigma factor [Pirellulales bacterium]
MDWSRIVELHGPTVWRVARRLLNNEADAADCFQRTFVSALELSRREPVANWGALLNRLSNARALDCLRERKRQAKRIALTPDEGCADRRAPSPLQAAGANELAQHLREALADLDPRQGQVFCLACLEGFSYDEIADQLCVTVNHVGVLLNRARTFLRARLAAHQPATSASQRRE